MQLAKLNWGSWANAPLISVKEPFGLMFDDKDFMLRLGEGIIIPAHSKHHFNASVQFKRISTVIKSGYEDR